MLHMYCYDFIEVEYSSETDHFQHLIVIVADKSYNYTHQVQF